MEPAISTSAGQIHGKELWLTWHNAKSARKSFQILSALKCNNCLHLEESFSPKKELRFKECSPRDIKYSNNVN